MMTPWQIQTIPAGIDNNNDFMRFLAPMTFWPSGHHIVYIFW
jgi:hypothetical protein